MPLRRNSRNRLSTMPAGLEPLTDAEARECKILFDLMRGHMGFVPNSTRTMARQPAILSSFTLLAGNILGQSADAKMPLLLGLRMIVRNVVWTIKNLRSKDRLPLSLKNMVAHVTSSASGCRYCQAHTIGEAADQGVAAEKLADLWNFNRSEHFDDAERAALRFAEAAGSTPNAVTPNHFVDLKKHYSEEQIVELGATVALFGFLNRWNDSFSTILEATPAVNAETHLRSTKWTAGKHQPPS